MRKICWKTIKKWDKPLESLGGHLFVPKSMITQPHQEERMDYQVIGRRRRVIKEYMYLTSHYVCAHLVTHSLLSGEFSKLSPSERSNNKPKTSVFRVAVKIKCSNNTLYRVSPVFCNLDAGASIRLQVSCFSFSYQIVLFFIVFSICSSCLF